MYEDKKLDLSAFIYAVKDLSMISIRISKNGKLIASHNWDDDCRRNVYSASKSFTAAAVGIAIREGLLSLDEKLVDAFKADLPENVSDNLQKATVRDLLTMGLGQENAFLMGGQRPFIGEDDWVKLSLSIPFCDPPGSRFVYNNVGPYLAGILVQRRAGCDLVSYLMPRLFKPLGIKRPMWEEDPQGNTFGAGGLFLNVEELHKFGLLFLQKGKWEDKQLIPEYWVKECGSLQMENGREGYGYLFWLGPENTYRADGKYCQLSIVCPEKDAVITMLAECRDSKKLQKAIYENIYSNL